MFPHNSSSHEISTETNAFVQNSKGDVVVLEGSSLSGAREGERPEHARYCDIEFINSSMMAAPISHPEATAANDFLTVLPRQSGELSFAGVGEACQSVATETTKNPTNHLLTYDNNNNNNNNINNNKVNNHNNAEHNHHKYRKQNTPGLLGQQLGSSADTSKSTCKPLSDNKDSFSDVSVRVLKVSVRVVVTRGDARRPAGVPSLVRIPKSDRPQRLPRLANFVDNYSLLGSRLDHGENNKFKANLSFVSNNNNINNNNSKSVILLSSTSYGDYYLLADGGLAGVDPAIPVATLIVVHHQNNISDCSRGTKLVGFNSSITTDNHSSVTSLKLVSITSVESLIEEMTKKCSLSENHQNAEIITTTTTTTKTTSTTKAPKITTSTRKYATINIAITICNGLAALISQQLSTSARKITASLASSSITLIVSKNGITDHTLQSFLDNLTKVRATSRLTTTTTSPLGHVTVSKLTQRICVPLLIKHKGYDDNNVGNNNINNNDEDDHDEEMKMTMMMKKKTEEAEEEEELKKSIDEFDCRDKNNDLTKLVDFCKEIENGEDDETMNISNNNQDVIEDIVNVAVCYKTSYKTTTNISMLGSQNDGIRRTEATMFTVGALSFQDNDKSNKPLNDSSKDNKYQVSTKVGLESNSAYIKSVSKSTPSVKYSDKSETFDEEIQDGEDEEKTRLDVPYEADDEEVYDDDDDDKKYCNDDNMMNEDKRVRSAVNIPTLTTCEPTMTLKCQSTTVTSQTNAVPVSRVENHPKYEDDDDEQANDDKTTLPKIRSGFEANVDQQQELSVIISTTDRCYLLKNEEMNEETPRNYYVDRREKASQDDHEQVINHRENAGKISDNDNIECRTSREFSNVEKHEEDDKEAQIWPSTWNWSRLIAHVRALIPAYQMAYKNNESECDAKRNELNNALSVLFGKFYREQRQQQYSRDPVMEYKLRWGIPTMLKLCGGGESSLNSGGGANWGSAPATTPNNNNANQSGWGGTPGNPPGSAGPPSNWGGNNVNRPVSGNPNSNQNQGPPGAQTNPGNVNKVNNPNQPGNAQAGPPTSQSANPTQGNQNTGGQWSQGKPNSAVGPGGQNPSAQNNNGNSVPQQPSGSNTNNNQVNNPAQGTVATTGTAVATNPSTKAQLEQLNTMREALFSQDGWGCQHVNQDTHWDVPTSPEPPALTKDGAPMWKPPVNTGTDLWEANLRNGGQPPPPQQAKTPWGHTPSTNIGGTWGEDDDAADSSNMWTAAPALSQPNTAQWPGATGNQTDSRKSGSSWGDPRIDPRDPRDLRSVDPREMRDPRDHRMSLDPRDHMRVMDPMAGRDPRMADMRGDPRGISGRLNGANADAMWGQPPGPPHHQMGGHQHPSGGPPAKMLNPSSMNQWAAPPPKDMIPGKPSGWEEPSPPTQRRNVPNYDDGTSLWGNPAANQRAMPGSKVSHWKDLPTPNIGRSAMQCPPGMPQNRMPGQPGMKPDVGGGPMWGHPGGPGGRNGSWADGPHDTTSWDEPKTPAGWNEPQLNPATWGGPGAHKSKAMGGPGVGSWADADMDPTPSWAHPAKPTLTKEVIWNSREFRYLCDLGYKKEDVEVALRNREMNRDEAQELLSQLRSLSCDQWRRHDAQSAYDPSSQATSAGAYPRYNHVAQQMSFPPGAGVPSGAATGVSGSVGSASLLKLQQQQQQQQQAAVQLQQQQPSANPPQPPFNQASRTLQNPPSTQQLRMLVQQIQLAVQEGYLNQQILNQPLAPPTLLLLNQLLQQIKVLQQLHQQHSVQNSLKGNSQTVLQISVQITKTKQQIANLQNQIAVQQATYMKQQQQQQQQQHPAPPSQSSEYYKTSAVHDPMSALQNSFSDLAMNKEPPVSQQQSRLNQWKLPSLDKDGDISANEFSRAPGTTSKPPQTPGGLSHTHSSPNMNPLLGQGDGTWSSRLGDSGWPDAGNNDATDGKDWQPGGTAFSDLVPEFEPGKPWKMKNIEDDPSITPGSVVRSLSLAAIKDPDAIFSSSSKTSPPPQSVNADTSIPSLSNSTWSFNPPATTPSAFTSSAKNTWTDPVQPTYSDLWGVPMRVRGPPPGLGSKAAGWTSGTWLLLKNLTPQIDGSTLKTLCMQHGPVLDFRLYLNHGIALTKYSTRDEATKAQGALNNCVLGNTTIFAESPVDNEAHTLLHTLSHGGGGGQQQTGNSGNSGWAMRPAKKAGPPPDTWSGSSSQLWGAPPTSNSLWSNSGIDSSDTQRTTPSSLNLYLPGDLLGGNLVNSNLRNQLDSEKDDWESRR